MGRLVYAMFVGNGNDRASFRLLGGLRWRFACGFHFRRGLCLPSVGSFTFLNGLSISRLWRGLSCWEASVTLYLWFQFLIQSLIAICRWFSSPERVIPFETVVRFFLLGSFSEAVLVVSILGMVYDCQLQVVLQAWGGGGGGIIPFLFLLWAVSRVEGLVRLCASFSRVYLTVNRRWHFPCGFDFRHVIAICGRFLLSWLVICFGDVESLWDLSKVVSSVRALLACRGLSCWETSVTFYLWCRF